jgi:hypothetical protein
MALKDSLSQKPDTLQGSTMLTTYQKELLLQGEREIDEALDEADEVVPIQPGYKISSHGADYTVDGLVKRLSDQDVVVPKFQRGYVWSHKDASRFIESLLLGLPVPSVFLSKDPTTEQLLVIDGQQRLLTLRYFYDGIWPPTKKEFSLKGVQSRLEGLTYRSLEKEDKRRLDNSILHAIIVRQEGPSGDSSSMYHIFERLNTSGVSLTAQEIRTAIQHGPFIELLKSLNSASSWRAIYGPVNKLMRDQELILRFLAFYHSAESYKRPMKGFLNDFAAKHRKLEQLAREEMGAPFLRAIEVVYQGVGKKAFRLARVLNAAVFDAVMVGVAKRLDRGAFTDFDAFQRAYDELLVNPKFLQVAERATADEESVEQRLKLATDAFSAIH